MNFSIYADESGFDCPLDKSRAFCVIFYIGSFRVNNHKCANIKKYSDKVVLLWYDEIDKLWKAAADFGE